MYKGNAQYTKRPIKNIS